MVARNLDRGSGVLRPQLETAPFPNYFVVEPPIYELLVVGLKRSTGAGLAAGGAGGLGLADGAGGVGALRAGRDVARARRVALLAVLVFRVFPLTIRYGRAFQPDASMLGAAVAGMACWDRYRCRAASRYWLRWLAGACSRSDLRSRSRRVPADSALLDHRRQAPARELVAAFATLLPALLWYAWADHLIGQGAGSRASADNRSIWLGPAWARGAFRPGNDQGAWAGLCSSARSRRWVPAWHCSGSGSGDSREAATPVLVGLGRFYAGGDGVPGWQAPP